MKSRLILAVAALLSLTSFAEVQAYRLERDTETEQLWLVGSDCVRRECCIMSPEEYMMLTGNLFKVWTMLNNDADGRRKLHGRIVKQEATNETYTVTYSDGYVFTEKMKQRTAHNIAKFAGKSHVPPEPKKRKFIYVKPDGTERYKAWKERMYEAQTNGTKTVTIVHDGATGKDVEVK